MEREWKPNTGVVPDEVTENTVVEVRYRDYDSQVWHPIFKGDLANDSPELWSLDDSPADVIFYRVLDG